MSVGCRYARPTYAGNLRTLFTHISLFYRRKKARLFLVGLSTIWSLAMSWCPQQWRVTYQMLHYHRSWFAFELFRFTTEFAWAFGYLLNSRRKKARIVKFGLSTIWSLAMSYFHIANATLSSALFRFTTEFGMESGGSKTLLSPSKFGR